MGSLRVYTIIPTWGLRNGKLDTNNFFVNQALALKKAGVHPVVIAVRFLPTRSLSNLFSLVLENEYIVEGLRVLIYAIYVPIPTVFNSFRDKYISYFYHRIIKLHLDEDVRSREYDSYLIHAHVSHECAYYCLSAAQKEMLPLIVTEHYSGLLTGAASKNDYIRVRKTIEKARKFIFVGTHFKEGVCNKLHINKPVYVIPNLVDKNSFNISCQKNDCFRFLSAGTLKKNKSFDLVIKAFHSEFNRNERVKLLIAGDGVERKTLESLVASLNENERISFYGEYQKNEACYLFSNSDAFVLTSEFETFGIVYVEAMLCGLPCIGTKGQGADDIINSDNGFLVKYGDIHELQTYMRFIYEHINSYDKQSIRKAAIELFSEESVTERLLDVYQEEINREGFKS